MVWRDDAIALTVCPVRYLTPEVKDALAWFDRTHTLQIGFGAAIWQRTSLPAAGGMGDQDVRLMEAIDYVRVVKNSLLFERPEKRPTRRQKARVEGEDGEEIPSDRDRVKRRRQR